MLAASDLLACKEFPLQTVRRESRMKAEKLKEMSLLLDFYAGLLTERQRELCDYYYNDDLSHTEIAAVTGITRQGVRDSLKKAEDILENAEEALGFLKAWRERRGVIDSLDQRLKELGVIDEALDQMIKLLRA
jgi:predicted DNA-binding protein YlxM (UPF0122 family)